MKPLSGIARAALCAALTLLFCEVTAMAGNIDATINGLRMVFDSDTGAIVEMSSEGAGKMLSTSHDNAGGIDLACPIPAFGALRLAARHSSGAKIEKSADGVTITWDSLGASRKVDASAHSTPGKALVFDEKTGAFGWKDVPVSAFDLGGPVSARVTFKAAPDGRSVIASCEIENKSKYSIPQVLFPDFDGILPFAGEHGTVFHACGVKDRPFETIKTSPRGCAFWPQDPGMNGKEYVPGAYFGTTLMTYWVAISESPPQKQEGISESRP
jgi:hypothetical protein